MGVAWDEACSQQFIGLGCLRCRPASAACEAGERRGQRRSWGTGCAWAPEAEGHQVTCGHCAAFDGAATMSACAVRPLWHRRARGHGQSPQGGAKVRSLRQGPATAPLPNVQAGLPLHCHCTRTCQKASWTLYKVECATLGAAWAAEAAGDVPVLVTRRWPITLPPCMLGPPPIG